jgi:choline-sulfatase
MLRQGDYKYVYHTTMDETHGPERELYNLADDPKEWDNIANSPEHKERVAQMHSCLVEELGQDPEITEKICREDYSRGYQRD